MSKTITSRFRSRRDAETAVEHLVQEHGIDRAAVRILPASEANSAGVEAAGADLEDGRAKAGTDGEPALAGEIAVSATVEADRAEAVIASFKDYGGVGT